MRCDAGVTPPGLVRAEAAVQRLQKAGEVVIASASSAVSVDAIASAQSAADLAESSAVLVDDYRTSRCAAVDVWVCGYCDEFRVSRLLDNA